MSACDAELCPLWDGDGCPCEAFGLDRDNLPRDGVFVREVPNAGKELARIVIWSDLDASSNL